MMDRRKFMVSISGGLLALSRVGSAQLSAKIPRIGVIGERSATDSMVEALRMGLRELGYTEGQNLVIEFRPTYGVLDRVSELARELIRLPVDVLVVGGTVSTQLAKAETTTVPIVFALTGDPVGSGLVANLARPGGNATGMSTLQLELSAKQLELLKAIAPRIVRIAVLYNPVTPLSAPILNGVRDTARALAVDLQFVEVRQPNELASALSALTRQRADALLVLSDPVFGSQLAQIAQVAARNRLPAVYSRREFAEAGGLVSYGPSYEDNWRRAATYVDKILKGATPADLPVQQPTRLELVLNRKTAKALGLTIPQSLLLRADEVIQ